MRCSSDGIWPTIETSSPRTCTAVVDAPYLNTAITINNTEKKNFLSSSVMVSLKFFLIRIVQLFTNHLTVAL